MWKKEKQSQLNETNSSQNLESSFSRSNENSNLHSARVEVASIGHTISINGKISGNEDLVIQGSVKGEIKLQKHTLSVGRNGKVDAGILAKIIKIEGDVKGDIEGSERVIISESGRVSGNIKSPRVILKDGSHFKGNIDMQQNEMEIKKPVSSSTSSSSNKNEAKKTNQNNFNNASNTNSNNLSKSNNEVSVKKKIDLRNL